MIQLISKRDKSRHLIKKFEKNNAPIIYTRLFSCGRHLSHRKKKQEKQEKKL